MSTADTEYGPEAIGRWKRPPNHDIDRVPMMDVAAAVSGGTQVLSVG